MSMPRLLVALSLAAAVTLAAPQDAEACSCMPPPDITTKALPNHNIVCSFSTIGSKLKCIFVLYAASA